MTRTTISIQFVLILATVIGIHGEKPREAILTVKSDFEDALGDREFRVHYPGVESTSAFIKIFHQGKSEEKVNYEVKTNVKQPQILHFELKKGDAPAGSYEVQVCLDDGVTCSDKRAALGQILDESAKPKLSCKSFGGKDENEFERYLKKEGATEISIPINAGKNFPTPAELKEVSAYSKLNIPANPTYLKGKNIFYAAVFYDGAPLKDLFKKIQDNGYCARKYVFWASAHIVDTATKEVKRRFRGTIIVSEKLAEKFILSTSPKEFPVEFARYDEEELPTGNYFVSVSFCASDKDRINSSICSEATYEDLHIEESE